MKSVLGLLRAAAVTVICLVMASLEIIALPIGGKDGKLFHALARFWARAVLAVCGITVKVVGLENLDLSRSHVYVSNHASMVDIPAIIASIPDQIRIVYKKELEAVPVFGWGLKWGHYIGIDRRKGSEARRNLEEAAEKIRHGASVLLYAEGTRTLDGKLQPFKRGAFNLAVRAGVPVIPLTVNGSYHLFPKRSLSVRPGVVTLVLGAPIEVNATPGKEAELDLMEQVRSVIAQHYVDQ
jgi:1-acyl-sn-glycerol-3-phosphate acyltransferase